MANQVSNVGFNDYSGDQADIERRRQLAQGLSQQSMQPLETQTAGGWAIPISPFQGLGKMLQSYAGVKGQQKATEQEKALGQKYQSDLASALMQAQQAGTGTPARTIQPDPQEAQQSADQGTPQVGVVNQPAVAPDRQAMARILMSHPGTAPIGMAQMQRDMQMQSFMAAGQPQGQPTQAGMPPQQDGASAGPSAAPTQQGQPAGFGGPAGGVPMAVWMNADPSGAKYVEQLAKDHKDASTPIVNRGFGIGTMVNGKYVPDTASEGQALSLKRGEEDIKSQYELVPGMTDSEGRPVYRSKASVLHPEQQRSMSPTQSNFQRVGAVPQQDESAIKYVEDQAAQGKTASAFGGSGSSQAPTKQSGQSSFDKDLAGHEAGRVSKMIEDVYDKGTHAIEKVAQNNKMMQMLPEITTGPLNKQVTTIKNLAKEVGVDIGDPTPNQEFEKYAIQGALATAKQIYGGRITNQDVTTQIMSNPGATLTEKAIYQLLKYDNEIQQRHIQKMTALGEYRRDGGDPREFPVHFAQKYPFQGVAAPEGGQTPNYQVPGPNLVKDVVSSGSNPKVRKYNPATGRIE